MKTDFSKALYGIFGLLAIALRISRLRISYRVVIFCMAVCFGGSTLAQPAADTPSRDMWEEEYEEMQEYLEYMRDEMRRLQQNVIKTQDLIQELRRRQMDQYLEIERRILHIELDNEKMAERLSAPAQTEPEDTEGDEYQSYQAARRLLDRGMLDEALEEFSAFLSHWRQSAYAANAWYWSGELYLQQNPPALEEARHAFAEILLHYPGHPKEPDAMFKLGRIQHLQGSLEQAEQTLRQLSEKYGDSAHSAVRLAESYLKQYF